MTVETLREEAKDLHDETVRLRRQLHERPEMGNELPVTREIVLEAIDGLPLDVQLHETTSGIAAMLTGGKPGPTVLLRGDMDALPLHEDTGLDFSSRSDGTMHACGHDTHVAMLAGAARLLSARRDEIPGRVLFMFQPGEEGHHGARFMLDEGLLDVPPLADGTPSPVTGAFALHITSTLPTGWVSSRGGPIMASADRVHHRRRRSRRARQRAVPCPRPDPDRLRDRAGDPDDGHPQHRRVRPVGGDRRAHHAPGRRTTSSPRRPRSKARSAP